MPSIPLAWTHSFLRLLSVVTFESEQELMLAGEFATYFCVVLDGLLPPTSLACYLTRLTSLASLHSPHCCPPMLPFSVTGKIRCDDGNEFKAGSVVGHEGLFTDNYHRQFK